MDLENPENAKKLTKKEADWLKKLEKVFQECPSKRIGLYTIGDSTLFAYDNNKVDLCKDGDLCDGNALSAGISLGNISTKILIDGVSG